MAFPHKMSSFHERRTDCNPGMISGIHLRSNPWHSWGQTGLLRLKAFA